MHGLNPEWLSVLTRLGAMFIVMTAGWLARRARLLGNDTTASLGRLTVDIAFPALTLTQMLQLVDASTMQHSASILLLGAVMLLLSCAVGVAAAPLCAAPAHRHTFAFLVSIPNWIFLPLPIAEALCGAAGVKVVLLINIPAQILLWTLGVSILKGGLRGVHSLRALLTNPGLVATGAGIALALLVPASREWHTAHTLPGAVTQGLVLLGNLTVPLSLVVIGAQLGSLDTSRATPWRELAGVLALRLLAAPLVTSLVIELLLVRMLHVDAAARTVGHVIASMPVAVSCGMFVERFGGDRDLASRATLFSTLASIATVPLVLFLVQHLFG